MLARNYGYTPQEIAAMTPAQQMMMLEDDAVQHIGGNGRMMHCDTVAEARALIRQLRQERRIRDA